MPMPLLLGAPAPYSERATLTRLVCANVTIQSSTMAAPWAPVPLCAIAHVEVFPLSLYWLMLA